jgi:hypothetical protein
MIQNQGLKGKIKNENFIVAQSSVCAVIAKVCSAEAIPWFYAKNNGIASLPSVARKDMTYP